MPDKKETDLSTIFLISDSTGETAEKILAAALAQFIKADAEIVRRRYIRTEAQIEAVINEAKPKHALLIFTFVLDTLRMKMREAALNSGLLAVDLLGPLLTAMTHFLGCSPQSEPGLLHQIDTEYFGRVEAVQFTVKHDDGQNLHGVINADIVLVGPSRTAKTPLSIYLARFGHKVANIPLVLNIPIPKILDQIEGNRVVGLIIDPHRLLEIRTARLKKLKQKPTAYANLDSIIQELNYCREIYRQHPLWGVIDVTGRAVEEVATDVRALIRKNDMEK